MTERSISQRPRAKADAVQLYITVMQQVNKRTIESQTGNGHINTSSGMATTLSNSNSQSIVVGARTAAPRKALARIYHRSSSTDAPGSLSDTKLLEE